MTGHRIEEWDSAEGAQPGAPRHGVALGGPVVQLKPGTAGRVPDDPEGVARGAAFASGPATRRRPF